MSAKASLDFSVRKSSRHRNKNKKSTIFADVVVDSDDSAKTDESLHPKPTRNGRRRGNKGNKVTVERSPPSPTKLANSYREPLSTLKLDEANTPGPHSPPKWSYREAPASSSVSLDPRGRGATGRGATGRTILTSPIRRLSFAETAKATPPGGSANGARAPPIKGGGTVVRGHPRRSKRAKSPPLPVAEAAPHSPPKSPRKGGPRNFTPPPRDKIPMTPAITPLPQRSPRKPARDYGVCYQRAKQCLHTSQPERGIVGREDERRALVEFLDARLTADRPGSLYISGPPGTGKTALLSDTLLQYSKFKVISANCMTLHHANHIYNKLLCDLCCSRRTTTSTPSKDGRDLYDDGFKPLSARQAMLKLQNRLTTPGPAILMVLDEIDQLDTKTQDVLYTLFEWPSLPNSRLVLIGIANALDLTDRILPRLQSRPHCLPELLQFAPYTRQQLAAIIEDRLVEASVDGECVMEPASIQFAARKVAALAGDVRKALDICRSAVEAVQATNRSERPPASPPSLVPSSPRKVVVQQHRRVALVDVVKVINKSSQNAVIATKSNESTFPLQQKLILCTLALLIRSQVSGKRQQILVGALHAAYSKIASKKQVQAVDQSEFISLLDLIETRGIISVKKKANVRSSKVTLNLEESDLQFALSDNKLMTSILSNGLVK